MNDINLKAILTPIAAAIAGLLATKLNFLGIDQATWNTMIFTILSTATALVLGLFTKTNNVIDTAGSVQGVKVVAPPEIANALPANNDVVSSTENKVVPK